MDAGTCWKPVLQRNFDLQFLARLALGRDGAKLSSAQHAEFAVAFESMVVGTYAARFDSFSGERFVIVDERALKPGRQLVETLLERPDDSPVRLNYVLLEREGRWRIVNVIAQGVSELSLRRAEYRAVMKRDGFDSLLEQIRAKTRQQAQAQNN